MKKISTDMYSCNRCGTCCRWPGYVRMTETEVNSIANFLAIPEEEFIEKYTEVTADRKNLSIIEKENGHCWFLGENGCEINPVKPQQCRDFPFTWRFFGWRKKCQMSRKPRN
ncbi:MAG: YkgJ family cysteine cluster protein [Lentisphaeria bacterium]